MGVDCVHLAPTARETEPWLSRYHLPIGPMCPLTVTARLCALCSCSMSDQMNEVMSKAAGGSTVPKWVPDVPELQSAIKILSSENTSLGSMARGRGLLRSHNLAPSALFASSTPGVVSSSLLRSAPDRGAINVRSQILREKYGETLYRNSGCVCFLPPRAPSKCTHMLEGHVLHRVRAN